MYAICDISFKKWGKIKINKAASSGWNIALWILH